MARYIDAVRKAEIIGTFMDTIRDISDEKETIKELRKCYDKLNALPTADIVEVVRCKDCIHSRTNSADDEDVYYCDLNPCRAWHSGDYCSYGYRKDSK